MSKTPLPAAPSASFNPDYTGVKDEPTKNCVASLARQVAAEFGKVFYSLRPQREVLLFSPSNKVYSITVDDNGTVSAAIRKL